MSISTTCRQCGAPIQFESAAEVIRCGECGAARAPDETPTAEVLEDAAPLAAELVAPQPARRLPKSRPRTDEALAAFATGCYWARVGLTLEVFGYVLGLVLYGVASLAADAPRGAPPFALFPVACTALGTLFSAWGRSSMLALGTAAGAERVLAFSAALACFRAALMCFALCAFALAVFGGRGYEDWLARGGIAVAVAGFLALLAEASALAGLSAAAAARELVLVRDRALAAVLALQTLGCAVLAIGFLLTTRTGANKGVFEVVKYAVLGAFYLWYAYAQFALYAAGAAVLYASAGRSRR